MEILGFAGVAAVLLGGAAVLGWLVGRTNRNAGSTHGGGLSGYGGCAGGI